MAAVEISRRRAPLIRLSALLALVVAVLFVAPILRSTETWLSGDPAIARRLLDLRAEQRDLTRRWETAQRGDARFEYDTDLRVLAARIEDLERTVLQPRRERGVGPWLGRAIDAPVLAANLVDRLLLAAASVVLALAAASALETVGRAGRRLGLGLAFAVLALPPPLLAEAIRRLAASFGMGPSAALFHAAALFAGVPAALSLLLALRGGVDRGRLDVARDLGLPRTTIYARIVLPSWSPALAFAFVAVLARLLGDLSIARLADEVTTHHFGEWLRYRIVAAVDYPGASVGVIAAAVVVTGLAALTEIIARRPPSSSGWASPDASKPNGRALSPTPAIAALVPLALAFAAVDAGPLATALGSDLLSLGGRWARAGLAAAAAVALALAAAHRLDDRPAGERRSALSVALILSALPTPVTGFALQVTAADLGLPTGPWVAIAASAAAALGPTLALLLLADPLAAAARSAGSTRDPAALWTRHGPRLPLAALLAVTIALATGDAAAVLGFDVRPRPWVVPPGAGLPLVLGVAGLALGFGLLAVAALERAERPRTRSRGIDV